MNTGLGWEVGRCLPFSPPLFSAHLSPENLDMMDVIHPPTRPNYFNSHQGNLPPGVIVREGVAGGGGGGEELMGMKNTVKVNHMTTPLHMNQIVVTNLADSPRNSRSSFTVPDIGRSLKNLQSFKDLFVSRKRIAIEPVIREGGWGSSKCV